MAHVAAAPASTRNEKHVSRAARRGLERLRAAANARLLRPAVQ
jgi:hypothetical protein